MATAIHKGDLFISFNCCVADFATSDNMAFCFVGILLFGINCPLCKHGSTLEYVKFMCLCVDSVRKSNVFFALFKMLIRIMMIKLFLMKVFFLLFFVLCNDGSSLRQGTPI